MVEPVGSYSNKRGVDCVFHLLKKIPSKSSSDFEMFKLLCLKNMVPTQ